MPFVVTATTQAKNDLTFQRTTAKEAVEKAIELTDQGMKNVAITDLVRGRTYRSDEFHLLQ
jgi:hypothetical protein